jgi:hypothetical protein
MNGIARISAREELLFGCRRMHRDKSDMNYPEGGESRSHFCHHASFRVRHFRGEFQFSFHFYRLQKGSYHET